MSEIQYVEVVHRYPVFTTLPVEDRASVQDIESYYKNFAYTAGRDKELERLENPACVVATRKTGRRKWFPCGNDVAEGADRCKLHGGPSARAQKPRRSVADLESEIARLRGLLAEKHGDDVPVAAGV